MKRISALLVDDDAYARGLLGSILRELGCTVDETVSSGEEAVRTCRKSRFDMLFVDIEMPGINGFETLKAILQDSPDQYIVMISAHSTLENVKKAIEYGARGFIVKPYTGAKVRDILEKYTRDDSPLSSGPATAAKADTNTDNPETAIVDLVVESSV